MMSSSHRRPVAIKEVDMSVSDPEVDAGVPAIYIEEQTPPPKPKKSPTDKSRKHTADSDSINLELRKIVHEAISARDVQSKIRECTMQVLASQKLRSSDELQRKRISEDELVEQLLKDGLIELVRKQCAYGLAKLSVGEEFVAENVLDDSLVITVTQGQAFLEHADTAEQNFLPHQEPKFVLHAYFQGQRLSSRPVSCSSDPQFNHSFQFKIPTEIDNPILFLEPVMLALVRIQPGGFDSLVSTHQLQWQELVLNQNDRHQHGPHSGLAAVEMGGVGSGTGVPAGLINLKVKLTQSGDLIRFNKEATAIRLKALRDEHVRSNRLFLLYAKQWWKEYLEIRPQHAFRLVKIFAPNECGVKRLITLSVKIIQPNRLIDTAREAARFVSLIRCENIKAVGAGKIEQWAGPHATMCSGIGDVEDHATLLCGLFLGLGIDAFVGVGTKVVESEGTAAYAWVISYGPNNTISVWDPLTGERWYHKRGLVSGSDQRGSDTLGCMFNNKAFVANIQASDAFVDCSLDITNPSKWKAMSKDALESVSASDSSTYGPPLQRNTLDVVTSAKNLESELRAEILKYRRSQGLGATWNADLSSILVQCLASYELEKRSGIVDESQTLDFQHAIKRVIPKGHTFKGYPVQFNHMNTDLIMAECLKDSQCTEILCARGDQVMHSIHVKIVPYPENTVAVWILLAVTYRSVL